MKQGQKEIRTIVMLLIMTAAAIVITACTTQPSTQTGRTVFMMTDAAADMGAVTSIKITVDSVKVLSENDVWTTVSTTPQTYDLLKLKSTNTQVLLADYNLTTGTYQQVRLSISKVVITDATGDHVAKLPSGELKIIGKIVVNENSTSTVKFDFIADESLHITGNGTYIFAPVVKFETRQKAEVDTRLRDNVRILSGKVDEDKEEGMDIDGNFGEGLEIRSDARLSIAGNKINEEAEEGRAVFAITDAAADMQSVTSVKITVDSVSVHSTAEGWTTVSSSAKTYDLLELKSKSETTLLADAQLTPGTYDQVRLEISQVVVTDENGTHEAKLPSQELKINGNLVVEEDSASTATFDFIADESLHMTGNGQYIIAPVIQVETRQDADVSVNSKNNVEIKNGRVNTNIKVGMDINGNVGVGVKIPSNANISIDTLGKINSRSGLSLN